MKFRNKLREELRDNKKTDISIEFKKHKVLEHLSEIDQEYCKIFADHYNLDDSYVLEAAKLTFSEFNAKKFSTYFKNACKIFKEQIGKYTEVREYECIM